MKTLSSVCSLIAQLHKDRKHFQQNGQHSRGIECQSSALIFNWQNPDCNGGKAPCESGSFSRELSCRIDEAERMDDAHASMRKAHDGQMISRADCHVFFAGMKILFINLQYRNGHYGNSRYDKMYRYEIF